MYLLNYLSSYIHGATAPKRAIFEQNWWGHCHRKCQKWDTSCWPSGFQPTVKSNVAPGSMIFVLFCKVIINCHRGSITSASASHPRRTSSNPAAPPFQSRFMYLPHWRMCFSAGLAIFYSTSSVCGWRYQARFRIFWVSLPHNFRVFLAISSRIQ